MLWRLKYFLYVRETATGLDCRLCAHKFPKGEEGIQAAGVHVRRIHLQDPNFQPDDFKPQNMGKRATPVIESLLRRDSVIKFAPGSGDLRKKLLKRTHVEAKKRRAPPPIGRPSTSSAPDPVLPPAPVVPLLPCGSTITVPQYSADYIDLCSHLAQQLNYTFDQQGIFSDIPFHPR